MAINAIDDYQNAQNLAIKTRLNAYKEKSGLSTNAIKELIERDFNVSINYGTLRNTLAFSKPKALDTNIVLFLQRLWHIPLTYLFAAPDAPEGDLSKDSDLAGGFTLLDDDFYKGQFHGYMYTPNPAKKDIVHFTIDFGNSALTLTHAKLTYNGYTTGADGISYADTRVCYGEPIDIKKKSTFIRFTNDDADFFILYFAHSEFHAPLYYRRGVAITYSNLTDRAPVSQNFILVKNKLSEAAQTYIPGLLSMTNDKTIAIPCTVAKKLCAENPYVARFMSDFGYLLEHKKAEYYTINEIQILGEFLQEEDCSDTLKALLLLKEHSSAPRQLVYSDNIYYSSFMKSEQKASNCITSNNADCHRDGPPKP